MKIFFILRSLANKGGVERTLTDKANGLAALGHTVVIVTYEHGSHPFAYELNPLVKLIDLECKYFTIYKYSFLRKVYEAWKLQRLFARRWHQLVEDEKPDIVVMTSYSTDFAKQILAERKHTRIIVEAHSVFETDLIAHNIIEKIRISYFLNTLKKCDMLITLTKGDAACWKKYISRVCIVPNPVSFYCEDIDSQLRQENRIISVGRLHQTKRFDRLINAFSLIADKFPEWHVDVFGEGECRLSLQKQIDSLGLTDRIILHKPTSDIKTEYQKSQMLVVSSDYEGFSLVLLEAMACGVPAVSTDCPFGPPEIINDGVTGLLAKRDERDLADKMSWLMSHDMERHKMGNEAHVAAARYKKENVIKEWEAAYLSVL